MHGSYIEPIYIFIFLTNMPKLLKTDTDTDPSLDYSWNLATPQSRIMVNWQIV